MADQRGTNRVPWEKALKDIRVTFLSAAQGDLAALKDAGLAVVPVEPTEAMLEAGEASYSCGYSGTPTATPDTVYRAMLRASQEG